MALDIIPKQEGGKLKAVASGTLPSGQPVVVNADGTVSVISGSSNTLGTEASIDASSGDTNIALAYDTANAKIVAIYRDNGNSGYGTAVVGTVSGTSISFGTAVVFESSSSIQPVVTYDSNASKIVISYYTSTGPNQGKSIVGTVSGTSISFGTPVDFGPFTDSVNYLTTCFDSNSNKVFVGFRQSGSGNRYSCVVGDVSGTSISFGSVTVIDSNTVSYCRSTFDSVNNKVIVSWRDHNNSFYGETAVGTISGTSISFGTTVVAASYNAHYGDVGFDSTSGKVVYAVGNAGNNQGNAYVGTVSGTGISWSSATLFNEGTPIYIEVNEDTASGKIVISFSETSVSYEGVLRSGTITGTTLSLDSAVVFSSTALGFSEHSAAYDSGNGQLVFGYTLTAGTAQARTYSAFSTNLTSENYIGMSGGAVDVTGSDAFVGTPVVFENADTRFPAATFDSNSNKVVIAYRDQGNLEYGTAIVGTVSGTNISFGTPVVFNTGNIEFMHADGIVFDSNSNKVVICYKNGGNSNYGTAIVGTVSGTDISFGTAAVFESATTASISAVFDSNSNKVVIAYKAVNPETATAIVGTVSSTSISFGSKVVFSTGAPTATSQTFDSSNNKVIIVYWDEGNSNQGTAIVGTVSGASISFGSETVFETSTTTKNGKGLTASFNPNAGKVVVAYTDTAESNYGKALVGTVSGTSISFGTAATFETASVTEFDSVYDAGSQSVIIAYKDEGNSSAGTSVAAFISGTSISFNSPTVFEADRTDEVTLTYDSFNNKTVAVYQNAIDSNDGTAVVFSPSTISAIRGQVADGDNATVDIVGTVSSNQVGLTAGQQYYVQTDGTIGTTPADPSVLAGTAVSATKLLVKT